MKTKEEYFKSYSNLYQFEEGPSEYLIDKEDFINAMEEYGKQMYNQAIEEASKEAQMRGFYMTQFRRRWRKMPENFEYDPTTTSFKWEVDKKSILKLKKQ